MFFVVDANVLIAAFLKAALTRELLLDERLKLVTPEHGFLETKAVLKRPSTLKRLTLDADALEELWGVIAGYVKAIPEVVYSPALKQALGLAVHSEDAPYIALALVKQCPIWTNDPDFSLEKVKSVVQIYTTTELLKFLQKTS